MIFLDDGEVIPVLPAGVGTHQDDREFQPAVAYERSCGFLPLKIRPQDTGRIRHCPVAENPWGCSRFVPRLID